MYLSPFSKHSYKITKYVSFRTFSTVYVWGKNSNGELGVESKEKLRTPQKLVLEDTSENIKSIYFGPVHSAVLTNNGNVFTSGSNLYGQLGVSSEKIQSRNKFEIVEGVSNVKSVVCGERHTMALTKSGEIYSWGYKGSMFNVGALGFQDSDPSFQPKKIDHKETFKSIACGNMHSLALTDAGKVFSWGRSDYGALGMLNMQSFIKNGVVTPSLVDYFTNIQIAQIYARASHNAAVSEDGKLYMWGKNDKNQLGIENVNLDIQSCETVPVHISHDYQKNDFLVKSLCLSDLKSAAISVDQKVFSWGQMYVWPTNLKWEVEDIEKLLVGSNYFLVLTRGGKLLSCGKNIECALNTRSLAPAKVSFFEGSRVLDVFAGENNSAAIVEQ